MLFNSIDFIIFFPIVVLMYYVIPKKIRYIWLLLASYFFYMSWNAKYAWLILFSTIVTYVSGLALGRMESKNCRKCVVLFSFLMNLSVLGFFKYFDFFIHNMNKVLSALHITLIQNPFSVLLPVGISFYTFQALSYTMDVYRGQIEPEKNFLKYALFVSFFPQLVAGPIERSGNLLRQIKDMEKKSMWSYEGATSGLIMMLWGLFMKMVIADRIAFFVNGVFDNTYRCGTFETILGAMAFAIQIYCDFGGYSAIAIGAAKVLGFDLMENFNAPYFSESIAEFWRRWHISLSFWFRDYLYIPLGGSRCTKLKKYRNIAITFLISGLWHGAAWTYVAWGGLHAVYQIIEDLIKPIRANINKRFRVDTEAFSYHLGRVVITFLLTSFAWILFRANSIGDAFFYVKNMFTRWNPWVLFDESLFGFGLDRREVGILFFAILLLLLVDIIRVRRKESIGVFILQQNLWFRYATIVFLAVYIIVYGEYGINFDSAKFIYFDF